MDNRQEANRIIRNHVLWSVGSGMLPFPLVDLAAVTAVQVDMLQQLARLYDVDFSKATGKTLVSALTGSTFAKLGASLVKTIPGVGSILGSVSMSVMAGASTYAVGQVVLNHLETTGNFLDIDLTWAKNAYNEAYERGKDVVANWEQEEQAKPRDVVASLEKLGELREKGHLTEEEFQTQKEKLLAQM